MNVGRQLVLVPVTTSRRRSERVRSRWPAPCGKRSGAEPGPVAQLGICAPLLAVLSDTIIDIADDDHLRACRLLDYEILDPPD